MPSLNRNRVLRITAMFAMSAFVAACSQPNYLSHGDRTDTVTFQAGDAVAYNKVVQTQNPWPGYAKRTHIHTNGEKIDLAIDRYKAGEVKETESVSTKSGG